MKCEKITRFKETLTSSLPFVEEVDVKQTKEHGKLAKLPCKCGETKGIAYTHTYSGEWKPLCKKCRVPTVIDITVRSMVAPDEDGKPAISPDRVLGLLDIICEIGDEHPVLDIYTGSTGLEYPPTRTKVVQIYKKFGMKLTKKQPVITLV